MRDVVHKYFCSTFVMNKKRVNYPIANLKKYMFSGEKLPRLKPCNLSEKIKFA